MCYSISHFIFSFAVKQEATAQKEDNYLWDKMDDNLSDVRSSKKNGKGALTNRRRNRKSSSSEKITEEEDEEEDEEKGTTEKNQETTEIENYILTLFRCRLSIGYMVHYFGVH